MQIQRAAEEMKAYVSSDPQERKKAIRWACWARPASCLQHEYPLFTSWRSYYNTVSLAALTLLFHAAQRVVRNSSPHLIIWRYTDALHLYLKRLGKINVKLQLLGFELYSSASFVGKCTWRTFQNRSYLARWEKCGHELTQQRVNTWKYSFLLSRTWSDKDRQGGQGKCLLKYLLTNHSYPFWTPEVTWEAEDGEGEPRRQHGADEDVAWPGAADGVQEAVLHTSSEPGVYWSGDPGGRRG